MKNDHRVRLTKMLLHKAMLNLLRIKPINKITVKEICETAQINRATFYLHYTDVYALLNEIHDHITDILCNAMHSLCAKRTVREFRFHINKAIAQNFEYFEYACGLYCESEFQEYIMNLARSASFELWKIEYPAAKESDLNAMYTYISYGGAAVIRSWVRNGMQQSPEELDELMDKMSKSTLNVLKNKF